MEERRQICVVVGLIKNREGKILLQKRLDPMIPDAHEKWEFPGGKIDYGEKPEEALIRETREEVGCDIKIKRLIPEVQFPVWTRTDGKSQQVFVLCYEAELVGGIPKPSDPKVAEVGWFTYDETLQLDTLRGVREYIELAQ